MNGVEKNAASNLAAIRIDELLDVRLSAIGPTLSLSPGSLSAVPFSLTNAGNGQEAFALTGRLDGVDGTIQGFAIDSDGDGRYDPAIDQRLDNATTPLLTAGTTVRILALVTGSSASNGGRLTVTSTAVTGSGNPGTDFSGRGDNGTDAIIGRTTAAAEAGVSLTIASGDPTGISLVKSQSVATASGGNEPVSGAIVTYTLESRFTSAGTVGGVRVTDPIPAGTAYVPGSLRLEGAALTDTAGDDAGAFDGAGIRVDLGDIAGPATRTVQFQVKIQ